jgi:uncharacterized repeat protein (TIGR03803 family)
MSEREASGMNKPVYVGLPMVRSLCPIIVAILLVLAGRSTNAQTVTNLHSFGSSPSDGKNPYAGLVQGSDGNFYGTAVSGGTNNNGTMFRISPSGNYTNFHIFVGSPTDGSTPYAGLAQGSDGDFYGTTYFGGTNNDGTVFRIGPGGSYTNLHFFGSYHADGANPSGRLVLGSDGNFYGTTSLGGTNNDGTLFRIGPGGNYTNLYSFAGHPADGEQPIAGLVQGNDGNFYGTTYFGGTNDDGTVFRIGPDGSYTNLHFFAGHPGDGANPYAGLVQGSDDDFYGTTVSGGTHNLGTVFKISPSGSYTILYSFGSFDTDGANPSAAVVQGSDGNFYGTTNSGGTNNNGYGSVFRISPGGSYTNIYSFNGSPNDGASPFAALVQGSDGIFYGTNRGGGTNNDGTVIKLTVPLNPPPYPINQITGIQLLGTNIVFKIPSIAYETYQLQFSSSMTPTNWVNVPGISVTNSIGALLTLTNFGGALQPQGFYRFDITP